MTRKSLLKKLKFSKEDFTEIEQTIKNAEQGTDGELVIAVAAESSTYAFWELFIAVITAFTLTVCLLPLAPQIYSWLLKTFGIVQNWWLPSIYIAIPVSTVSVLYYLFNIPFFDRIIIPEGVKKYSVDDRAIKCFVKSGVYRTKESTGILIYVSYFERRVKIIADSGVSSKITPDLWKLIADEIAENIGKGKSKEAFILAAQRCGDILKEYFPSSEPHQNQLSDRLLVLHNQLF